MFMSKVKKSINFHFIKKLISIQMKKKKYIEFSFLAQSIGCSLYFDRKKTYTQGRK